MNNLDGVISLLIACIELILLINLLIFADKNRENLLVFLIILLLTGYQIYEFLICGLNMQSARLVYFAFDDISFLPPLSLTLVFIFLKMKSKILPLIFLPALFFIIYYSTVINQFAVVKCTVLYAVYNYPLGTLYGLFYYLPVITAFILLYRKWKNDDPIISRQTRILIIGYYFILIPVIASFLLFLLNLPGLLSSIESILCKFAFGYAVALSFFALNNKSVK